MRCWTLIFEQDSTGDRSSHEVQRRRKPMMESLSTGVHSKVWWGLRKGGVERVTGLCAVGGDSDKGLMREKIEEMVKGLMGEGSKSCSGCVDCLVYNSEAADQR